MEKLLFSGDDYTHRSLSVSLCVAVTLTQTYAALGSVLPHTKPLAVTRWTYWTSHRGDDMKSALMHFVASTFNFSKIKGAGGSNMAPVLHAGPTLSISGIFPTWSCVAWQPHSKHDGIPWGPGVSQCVTPASPAFHYKPHTQTHTHSRMYSVHIHISPELKEKQALKSHSVTDTSEQSQKTKINTYCT